MRCWVPCICVWLCLGVAAASAQSWGEGAAGTPRFEVCLPEQMAAFDAALQGPGYGADWYVDRINVHWVQHCGYLAMGICEDSDARTFCQVRLRMAFDAGAARMRALLPVPGSIEGELAPLYGRLHALAHGANAGDDCDGTDTGSALWCDSFQAVLKWEEAVWAWQVARLMGVMGPLDWDVLSDLGG